MDKFKVVTFFRDSVDGGFVYHAGDEFPRHGYTPTDERIKELSTKNNKRNTALIKKMPKKKKPAKAVEENVD